MKSLLCVGILFSAACACADRIPVPVKALDWPQGKRAAWCLSFDDGCNSHLDNVLPILESNRVHATFYVCTDWPSFVKREREWGRASEYLTLGNHTATHRGVKTPAELEKELSGCNEAIRRVGADRRWPRLIAFAVPGAETIHKVLEIGDEEYASMLERHHLVERSPYFGFPEVCRQIKGMTTYVDSVIAGGGMGHLDFHGIGGDWLDPGLEYFHALMKKLDKERDRLWFAPYIDVYKYMRLRDEAQLLAWKEDDGTIAVEMKSALDPTLYDVPLWVKVRDERAPGGFSTLPVRPGRNRVGTAGRAEIASSDIFTVTPQNGVWDEEYSRTGDAGDCSFSFRVVRYADGIGVKAKVIDDAVVTDDCKAGTITCPSWDDDNLECFFDGDNNKAKDSRSGGELKWGGEFTFVANGAAQSDFSGLPKSFGDKWKGTVSKTAVNGGYELEYDMWFSWACLGRDKAPAPGEKVEFGFNICIHDDDDGKRNDHALYWKGNPAIPYRDESRFGTIEFAE